MTMMPTSTGPSMAGPGFMGLGASPQGGMSPMTQALMMFGTGLLSGDPRTQGLARGFQGVAQAYSPQAAMQRQLMQGQLEELQRRRAADEEFKRIMLGTPQSGDATMLPPAAAAPSMVEPASSGSLVDMPGGGTDPGQVQSAYRMENMPVTPSTPTGTMQTAPVTPSTPAGAMMNLPASTRQLMATLGPQHPLTQSIMAQVYKPQAAQKPTTLQQNLEAAGFKPGTPAYQARMAAAIPGATGAQREKAQDAAGFWRWVDSGERVFPDVSKPAEQPDPGDVPGMRKEFSGQSKDYRLVRDAFRKIQRAATGTPSAGGDMSLIFSYMKMLDPGSTVREGEFATAQNTAGVPTRVRNLYNQAKTGQMLAPEQRADFLNQSSMIYNAQAESQSLLEDQYRGLATRAGFDPENVVIDYQGDLRTMQPAAQAAPETAAPEAAAPTATNPETGERLILRNGKWEPM